MVRVNEITVFYIIFFLCNNICAVNTLVFEHLQRDRRIINAMKQTFEITILGYYQIPSRSAFRCWTGPRSAVGNVSGYRCVSDCRSRGRDFDPTLVLYFRGDWSRNNFYGHSPPFRWFIQEGLLSVISESMCTNYWLTACSSLPRKKCG